MKLGPSTVVLAFLCACSGQDATSTRPPDPPSTSPLAPEPPASPPSPAPEPTGPPWALDPPPGWERGLGQGYRPPGWGTAAEWRATTASGEFVPNLVVQFRYQPGITFDALLAEPRPAHSTRVETQRIDVDGRPAQLLTEHTPLGQRQFIDSITLHVVDHDFAYAVGCASPSEDNVLAACRAAVGSFRFTR